MFFTVTLIDGRRGKIAPGFLNGKAVWIAIGLQVLLAVVYTTPWDNYLVATGVWFYNPQLISGVVLGWVPLEEYTFFVLETILVGLWWWFLVRRLKLTGKFKPRKNIRLASTVILGGIWLLFAAILIAGWKPATYLTLILTWALPAIMLQLAFGADILWHYRKLVVFAILPVFLYISAADSLAISSGTWTIDPTQSLGIFIGKLPIEEAAFFLATVTLIGFGLTLSLARVSQAHWTAWSNLIRGRIETAQQALSDPPS
jgi:lycopene beta-cyclase